MLKKISPLLNADVLYALRLMGHNDYLIVSSMNFPSSSLSQYTRLGKPLYMENVTAAEAIEAILDVMPLDSYFDNGAGCMEAKGAVEPPAVQREVQAVIEAAEGKPWPLKLIPHDEFFERAKKAFCIIQTGERRFHGCFSLTKGAIRPDVIWQPTRAIG
jgi:L-fucose mutarotase